MQKTESLLELSHYFLLHTSIANLRKLSSDIPHAVGHKASQTQRFKSSLSFERIIHHQKLFQMLLISSSGVEEEWMGHLVLNI